MINPDYRSGSVRKFLRWVSGKPLEEFDRIFTPVLRYKYMYRRVLLQRAQSANLKEFDRMYCEHTRYVSNLDAIAKSWK